jgi:predicted amidohydrolase YtcJ
MEKIDLLLYNGIVLTMDKEDNQLSWIAVRKGRIIDLGDDDRFKDYIDLSLKVINLEGNTVLPGFFDSHVHLVQTGLNSLALDASQMNSVEELIDLIERESKSMADGELIRVVGYDEHKTPKSRMPTRYELDFCCPNNSVWINTIEFHTSVVNSLALHRLNLPFNLEGVVRDEKNLPNGNLVGTASAIVRHEIFKRTSDSTREEGIYKALDEAITKGITTINSMEGGFTFHNKDAELINKIKDSFPIDLVLFYQTLDIDKLVDMELKRVGGCVFVDGSFRSRTAALLEPYYDDKSTKGVLYFTQDELNEFVNNANKNNMQIALHAIGERAIEQVLNSYEYALSLYPRQDHRHRIEHFELATDEQILRAKKLNIILSMQPTYETFWGGENKLYNLRLGPLRSKKTNPFRKIIDKGLIIAGGSDSDVTPMDPILGIHSAVNHPVKESSVSVVEAIKMFTINGAKAVFEEDIKGTIEKGKYADFVILDRNPVSINREKIKDIKVLGTIKEGNLLFIK